MGKIHRSNRKFSSQEGPDSNELQFALKSASSASAELTREDPETALINSRSWCFPIKERGYQDDEHLVQISLLKKLIIG